MAHRLNARVDDELAAKVEALRRLTKKSTTDIVKAAIELYYDTVRGTGGRAADLLEQAGFIGCADGPEDLSESYKDELASSLADKA